MLSGGPRPGLLVAGPVAKWNRPDRHSFRTLGAGVSTYFVTNQTPPTDAQPSLAVSAVAVAFSLGERFR